MTDATTSSKQLGEIIVVAGVEPHALGVAPRQDAEAVVLDLVEPAGAAARALAGDGRQGPMKPTARPLRCNMMLR